MDNHLFLEKSEVVGNLLASRLGVGLVYDFSCGEYFESETLLKLTSLNASRIRLDKKWWVNGVAYNLVDVDGAKFIESLGAYGDEMIYVLRNISTLPKQFIINGEIRPFCWYSDECRRKLSKLVEFSVQKRYSNGFIVTYNGSQSLGIISNFKLRNFILEEGKVKYDFKIKLDGSGKFVFGVFYAPKPDIDIYDFSGIIESPERVYLKRQKEVAEIFNKVGEQAENNKNADLWKLMWYVIFSNRVRLLNHPVLRKPFNMPSKFAFRHQWLWDSAFHAVVYTLVDVEMAKEELQNLFYAQKEDGRIPHEIFLSKYLCKIFWNVDDFSPWTTQPPVLALAVDRIMQKDNDLSFLKEAFEALDRYDAWFRRYRDADRDQLISYVDYLESGWDNSVRWDEPIRLFRVSPLKYQALYDQVRMAPVEAVDLNCFIYLQRRLLSNLAKKLNLKDVGEKYSELAEETRKKILEFMWDDATGFFYDVLEEDHRKLYVKTPAAFITLYAGIVEKEQAEKLVERLFNRREFWTKFPLPSVSADDPCYDPKGYWRGRSWLNMVWFTYWGLKNYGYVAEARELAEKVLENMNKGPTCNENYDSETGEPLGAVDFGWSTLMLDIIKDV